MILTLSVQAAAAAQPETKIVVTADTIYVDGVGYDLSPIPDGGEGEWPGSPLIGVIRRINGVIHATVLVRLDGTAAANQPTDAAYWTVDVIQGRVTIPAVTRAAQEAGSWD